MELTRPDLTPHQWNLVHQYIEMDPPTGKTLPQEFFNEMLEVLPDDQIRQAAIDWARSKTPAALRERAKTSLLAAQTDLTAILRDGVKTRQERHDLQAAQQAIAKAAAWLYPPAT
jgi:hypothetical protein